MKKEKIKNILLIVIVALVTSFVTAYGVSSTFDSSNVCYKVDSNTGASVQDTIDDLYGRASDYSELKSYFQNNPTSRFYGNEIHVGYNTTNGNSSLSLYGTNNKQRASLYYYSGDDTTVLTARNSNEENGKGKLNLAGNPVTINGVDVFTIQYHSWTDTTNGNGVVRVPSSVCRPSNCILLALFSGDRAYGYVKYDNVTNDHYAFQVINLITSSYTRVVNTSLTFSIGYLKYK